MKQHIKTVKEFNKWRRGELDHYPTEAANNKNLGEALDEVVKSAERYELLRTLNVEEFKQLWHKCLQGGVYFDGEVDKLIEARK